MTTENVETLPDFVRFAQEAGADGVVAYYNYIYRKDQIKLSCWYAQKKTNSVIDNVIENAKRSGSKLRLTLPPKFNEKKYFEPGICSEAWSQIMINPRGDIITCDVAGDSRETLIDKDFMDVWNGKYFTDIRTRLLAGNLSCSRYCFRANPSCVNDLRSHIITRGKTEDEIKKFLE